MIRLDATVQVAAFGIIATLISTAGVVIVAMINKQTPSPPKPSPSITLPTGEDVPDSEWAKIFVQKENAIRRREETIVQLRATVEDLEQQNDRLRAEAEHCRKNHT